MLDARARTHGIQGVKRTDSCEWSRYSLNSKLNGNILMRAEPARAGIYCMYWICSAESGNTKDVCWIRNRHTSTKCRVFKKWNVWRPVRALCIEDWVMSVGRQPQKINLNRVTRLRFTITINQQLFKIIQNMHTHRARAVEGIFSARSSQKSLPRPKEHFKPMPIFVETRYLSQKILAQNNNFI